MAKRLADCFEVRAVDTTEAAWDALVLDAAIVGIVCGLPIAAPETLAMVERVRASRLTRLREIPLLLMISDSFTDEDRLRAQQAGVSGFVLKAAPSSAAYSILAAIRQQWPDLPGLPFLPERRRSALPVTESAYKGSGVLVFGLDGYEDLSRDFGVTLLERAAGQLSELLSATTGSGTRVELGSKGRVMVTAQSATKASCSGFAARICQAMATGRVRIGGQQLQLTVSAGVAATPEDGYGLSLPDMLKLAEGRLECVRRIGCKHVVIDDGDGRFDFLLALPPAIPGLPLASPMPGGEVQDLGFQMLDPFPELETTQIHLQTNGLGDHGYYPWLGQPQTLN